MAITEHDFLTSSKKLAAMPGEADWRSAISRAYYAAFHAARRLLTDLSFTVPRADRAHGYLMLRLQNCGVPVIQKAGADLSTFRGKRNVADYDIHHTITAALAQMLVRHAEDLLVIFEGAAHEPTRTAIADAMKIYERDVLKDVTWHP
jgi:uncharacterized protein (UPF0332 family)